VFPVRYELNSYIFFRRNSVFKGLISALVSLTLRPLYSMRKRYLYPLDRRWVGPTADINVGKKIKYVALQGIERRLLGRPAHSLITVLTELSHAFLCKSVDFNRCEGNDISLEYQTAQSLTLQNML
jgi:hypothetical protein